MDPTLGGGSLLEDIQTPTDPGIKTPLLDLLEDPASRTYGFWAAEKIQYTRHSPYYFVDILMLAGNEEDVVALELLKTADAYEKCCWHDDQYWAQHLTGYARIYYYRLEDYRNTPDYLYALYEGQIVAGEPRGFGRYIHGLHDRSFIGYFKDGETADTGLGLVFEDGELFAKGPFLPDTKIFSGKAAMDLTFNKFDNEAMCGAYQVHMAQWNLCQDCPGWNFPAADGRTCVPKKCESEHQFINPIGECQECPGVHTFPDDDGFGCNKIDCAEGEYLTRDGECSATCGEHEYHDLAGKRCVKGVAAMREILG
jgi:hypothetical protein